MIIVSKIKNEYHMNIKSGQNFYSYIKYYIHFSRTQIKCSYIDLFNIILFNIKKFNNYVII